MLSVPITQNFQGKLPEPQNLCGSFSFFLSATSYRFEGRTSLCNKHKTTKKDGPCLKQLAIQTEKFKMGAKYDKQQGFQANR